MDLEHVDRITAGAVGEPGERSFYLQARTGTELVTLILEKQQVELLSASILDILSRVGKETGEGPSEEELELEEPLEPVWRVGRLSIGYEEERDRMVLELEELVPEDEDEEGEEGDVETEGVLPDLPEPDRIRVWATREQMLALSRQGATVAAAGRPRCEFCGNPIDPEGHTCPAMNGHRGPARR
ncbi:MAG TPA: DUF3090 family protein [Actinomycetota bacterium]|jgi:uncharacterized repeat protein (TIGR03847 family)